MVMIMEPPRKKLCLLLVVLILLSVAVSGAVHGANRLAEDSSNSKDRIGADETTTSVINWSSSTTIRRSGGGHGHGRGHGRHGRGRGRGRGPAETPAVFFPRTVTGGHHGRNAAAASTNPGRSCAVGTCILLGAAILLRRL